MVEQLPKSPKELAKLAGKSLIKKLREVVQPPGKKGTWMRYLTDEQLAEVYYRLRAGQRPATISRIAQDEWHLMKQSARGDLSRIVIRFRNKVLNDVDVALAKGQVEKEEIKALVKKAKHILDKLDTLGRYRWVIDVQTKRIAASVKREQERDEEVPQTDQSIRILGELLKELIKLEIELGLKDSVPNEVLRGMKQAFDEVVKKIPDGGMRMGAAALQFLEMAEKDTVVMARGKDGQYEMIEENAST